MAHGALAPHSWEMRKPLTDPRHGFENMEVFGLALDFLQFADLIEPPVARRKRFLNEDFQSAAVSILANVGEGATELSPRDKKRFYRYALRSTGECSALLHGIERLDLLPAEQIQSGKALLLRLRINLLLLLKAPCPALRRGRPASGAPASRPSR